MEQVRMKAVASRVITGCCR